MSLPDSPQWSGVIKVYFYDTDAGGVVHNIAYLRMIEWARTELAEFCQWPVSEMSLESGACPVVVRTEIDYLQPARLGDRLLIEAEITDLMKVRFNISFLMTRESDGVKLCRVKQVMATLDLQSGKPVRLRQDWREQWPEIVR
ncbi:MAG: thioesterase family protein [Verrucomicrobiota bacterium]